MCARLTQLVCQPDAFSTILWPVLLLYFEAATSQIALLYFFFAFTYLSLLLNKPHFVHCAHYRVMKLFYQTTGIRWIRIRNNCWLCQELWSEIPGYCCLKRKIRRPMKRRFARCLHIWTGWDYLSVPASLSLACWKLSVPLDVLGSESCVHMFTRFAVGRLVGKTFPSIESVGSD